MLFLSNVAKLYDGSAATDTAVRAGVDVLIDGARIHAIEPHRPDRTIGPDHAVVDCSRYTVTPGLIDCHGHVTVLGLDEPAMERMRAGAQLLWVERILHTTLVDGGVTTMRDVGGATHLVKRLVDDGTLLGPRLAISICMLSTTGGHADFRGPDRCHAEVSQLWEPGPGRPASIVDGPWECRKRVREIAACGADLVKLCTSPGVASPGDKLEHRDFTAEEIAAICDEAAARGLPVAAHAHSKSGIRLALENGVHDLQHVSYMDEELVERAHERGCVVTPTSWVVDELQRAEGLSAFVRDKVKQVAEVHERAVRHAAAGGLPILMGTDPVLPGMHGRNYMELHHLIRDGVAPLAAWYGATGLAASELGRDDVGVLAAGRRADVLVCAGDVLGEPALLERGALVDVLQDGVGHRGLAGVPQRTFASGLRESLWPGYEPERVPDRPPARHQA